MKRTISFLLVISLVFSLLLSCLPVAAATEHKDLDPVDGQTLSFSADKIDAEARFGFEEDPEILKDADIAATGENKDVTEYSYSITPLMTPFNYYFFVKTDNPNPNTFVFADHDTVYSENGDIISSETGWLGITKFADIKYDDEKTGRVNGGYVFMSKNYAVDGGTFILQKRVRKIVDGYVTYPWEDTDVKASVPKVEKTADYLIERFSDPKKGYFENLDAIQEGFQSICFYSGSNVRGTLKKEYPYWWMTSAGYIDQSFYIFSPYMRSDNRSLFASAIYPFRYDSLGFPGMMASVAQRLNKDAIVKTNENYHWLVDVTYEGKTKSYGGQGEPEGQGISEDKIIRYFTFDKNDLSLTLEEIYDLLKYYCEVKMDDDIPREDELTWEFVCDTVGEGAWVKLGGIDRYTYLYTRNNTNTFNSEEWGVGYKIYWGGKMGYFTDTWVDGRYIGEWRYAVPGATFEDHPEAAIYLRNITFPLISTQTKYVRDPVTNKYVGQTIATDIREETKSVIFTYNSTDGMWEAVTHSLGNNYADYQLAKKMVEQGNLDAKYLDALSLTLDEVKALRVDRNTDGVPYQGYSFDRTVEPGTPFGFDYLIGDTDGNGQIEIVDATHLQRHLAQIRTGVAEDAMIARGDTDENGSIELTDITALQYYLADKMTVNQIGKKKS